MLTLRSALARAQAAVSLVQLKAFDIATPEGRSRERYRRIAMSSASSLIAKLVSTVTLLVSIPLTLDYLGRERFGLWAALSTVIGFLALTDLGVGNALINATSRALGKEDRGVAQRAVSSGFFILMLQGLFLVFAFMALHSLLDWSRVFNVHSSTARAEAEVSMSVLVAVIAFQLPFGAVQRIQEGFQEGYVGNLWQAAASCAGLAGLLVVMHCNLGLPWLVGAVAGAPVLMMMANSATEYFFVRPWLRPRLRFLDRATCRELLRSGCTFLTLAVLTFGGIYSDNLIISRMLGASAVAEYAVVQRLSLVAHLFWAFIVPLWPAYSEALSRGEYEWMRKAFARVLRGSVFVGLILGIALAVLGRYIIALWVGPDMAAEPAVLYGFASYILLSGVIGSIAVVMNSGPFLHIQLWLLGAAALVSISLKIALCVSYGMAAVIWATVVAFAVFYVIPGLWIIRRFIVSAQPADKSSRP